MENKPTLRRRVIARPCGPSMTKQSFKDDCDFNKLLKKFGVKTGLPSSLPPGGVYMDTTAIPSSQQAHQQLLDAVAMFNQLPSKIRAKYGSPAALLAALSDPLEASTLQTLGVTQPRSGIVIPRQDGSRSSPKDEHSSSGQDETAGTEPARPSKKAKSSDSSSSM